MKIALFGATGLTGPSLLREALARGHEVVALTRHPSAITVTDDKLRVLGGNPLVAEDVAACLDGCDVVIHCLGIGGRGDGKPSSVVSDSIALLLPIMKARGVRRLVAMSNVGAGGSGPWIARKFIIPVFVRWLVPILVDKDRMEGMLQASDVEWVAPRFPEIVEGPAKPTRTERVGFKITTGSVATFLLDHVEDAAFVRATPSVSN
jgi:uncharacterized protein YbjT (DUF2867 family)